MSTVAQEAKQEDPEEAERQQRIAEMPSLSQCFNLHDFEAIARRTMKKAAWGYYSSAADDEIVSFHIVTTYTSKRRFCFLTDSCLLQPDHA